MSDLHTWSGLLVGWIVYAMFLTGTVSYFRDELSEWMRPELPAAASRDPGPVVAERLIDRLRAIAPGAAAWTVDMPTARSNVAAVSWRTSNPPRIAFLDLHPVTGEALAARDTRGGDFFYAFHYQFHYLPYQIGRLLAGVAGMFMLVAIVSGVITHKKFFADFFTFRWRKGQRTWLDAHNAAAVLGLPFHVMVTYSGLVILMHLYMPWGNAVAFETPAERQRLSADIAPVVPPAKATGRVAKLANIAGAIRLAESRWGQGHVGRLLISNPDDAAAKVVVVRDETSRASRSPQYLIFDAAGALVADKGPVGPAAETHNVLYALHLGRFADYPTRWLYFLVSLGGTAMVGTGLVLWVVKRRQKLSPPDEASLGLRFVERLNVAAIAGLSIAMAGFLWANRLLPSGVPDRREWEIHVFFVVWLATFAHAVARPARKAWFEQLALGATLLLLLPVINAVTTGRGLVTSVRATDWVFAGVDLTLLALGAMHAVMAVAVLRHRPVVKHAGRKASGDAAGRTTLEHEVTA